MTFNKNNDFSKFLGLEINFRHILNFSIDIDNLLIKIPNYIKNIILIEMKEYLIDNFKTHLIKNKRLNNNNLKLYYTDENNLDLLTKYIENNKEKDGINFIDDYYIEEHIISDKNTYHKENNEIE